MLGMKNHFDISGSIEIHEVNIAGVACILKILFLCLTPPPHPSSPKSAMIIDAFLQKKMWSLLQ